MGTMRLRYVLDTTTGDDMEMKAVQLVLWILAVDYANDRLLTERGLFGPLPLLCMRALTFPTLSSSVPVRVERMKNEEMKNGIHQSCIHWSIRHP